MGDCETAGGAGGSVGGRGDGFDGEDWSEEFGCVVFFCCVLEDQSLVFWKDSGQGTFGFSVAAERYTFL